jgi:hypothetical protein
MVEEYDFAKPGKIDYDEFKAMLLADPSPTKTPYPRALDTVSNTICGAHAVDDFGSMAALYLEPVPNSTH